jgi:hypothetical protein
MGYRWNSAGVGVYFRICHATSSTAARTIKEIVKMYNQDSFYAINKLVEFAHGDSIQKQMTGSMNEIIANMRVPGVDNPMRGTRSNAAQKLEEKTTDEN